MSLLTRALRPPTREPDRSRARVVAARVTTVLAGLLVLVALLIPDQVGLLTPAAFVRIPVEAIVGVALILVLPGRIRRVVAVAAGVVLGLLTILKIFNMGFFAVLDRPFDPVIDWTFLTAGADYLTRSVGRVGAIAAVVVALVLAVAVLTLTTLSVLRLTRLAVGHRTPAIRTVAAAALVWVICAVVGVQFVAGQPVAASSAAGLAYDLARQAHTDLRDHQSFAARATDDSFRNVPGPLLLNGLRGKDVVVAFVESYGRVAVEDPPISARVNAVLAAGGDTLHAAGFVTRSAWLTSSTYAGGSWLAHSTLASGMWINNQQLYNDFGTSDRLTLNGAFQRAGWRTVDVEPANTKDLPAGVLAGYDKVYDERNLGYRGERFTFNSMPDQYTLAAFQRAERAAGHTPVMADIALLSSHSPWTPIPRLIGWDDIGVGYGFTTAAPTAGAPTDPLQRTAEQVRVDYGRTVEYSLNTLLSYLLSYGDDNLVMVILGDHQPAATVTGDTDNRDVPVTIVAHDPSVLDRISGWGWQDGLKPGAGAPVWRMDTFRDRFLTAFAQ